VYLLLLYIIVSYNLLYNYSILFVFIIIRYLYIYIYSQPPPPPLALALALDPCRLVGSHSPPRLEARWPWPWRVYFCSTYIYIHIHILLLYNIYIAYPVFNITSDSDSEVYTVYGYGIIIWLTSARGRVNTTHYTTRLRYSQNYIYSLNQYQPPSPPPLVALPNPRSLLLVSPQVGLAAAVRGGHSSASS